ncbi:MAG: sulfotransferase family 2 domain-containing protein [Longimicrobiales bacterium]
MIISHRHKFIFLKPRKVAGTSVEVALGRHCGDEDIITPIGSFNAAWDQDDYVHRGKTWPGYTRHAPLKQVRAQIGSSIWDQYFKFSIVRNPWDLVVSQYHWATRAGASDRTLVEALSRFLTRPTRLRRNLLIFGRWLGFDVQKISFEFFATYMLGYYPLNRHYYFDHSGRVALDHVIRYENLESGFREVCELIGIPASDLPSLKSKLRSATVSELLR